ncbi:MAG: sodium:alanine symporter family protein [Eubacterium sp.]|jgi:AGCS family alanine or glycine:cation symporter|nr:sodium:alanine symporter family protein [Eubacterium sp.]
MEFINNFISWLDTVIWAPFMVILLLGTHIFLTLRTGFIQRKVFTGIKLSVTKDPSKDGDVSPFQALTTALASTIGTGNIVGVGTAIFFGGPGAVFWCWITGVFGIATKYAESLISIKYRVKSRDGRMLGGAMYVLERGLNMKWLGMLFALFALLASFGIGSAVQVNAISEIVTSNVTFVKIPPIAIGIVLAVITAFVIIGGIKKIAIVCEKLVPTMAACYVIGCFVILGMNHDYIIPGIKAIIKLAFAPGAVAGGLVGRGAITAAQYGIARGLFSNESGLGSAPLVAAAAKTKNPVRQALISATGTFWDTVVVCLITGITLVTTIMKNPEINMSSIQNGGQMTTAAFSQIPVLGSIILVFGIITFAYTTVLGWSYYGERCAEYLFGKRATIFFKIIFVFVILLGPVIELDIVWSLSDIFNALMAVPNIIALVFTSGLIAKETKKWLNNLEGTDDTEIPTLDK